MITFLSTRSPAGAAVERPRVAGTRVAASTTIGTVELDSLIPASPLRVSGCRKQKMPQRVDKRVHNRRSKDRSRRAPRPAVEQSSDRGEQDVAPVGKSSVGDVRKPEQ